MGEELTRQDTENLVGEFGLKRYYKKIIEVLKYYMDIEDKYYSLIAIWIIGTYLHKQFVSYPYLFFNAMRGSGKSRMLRIIANLSYNGKMASSMTEAVLFRTAKDRTFCIDEFESIGRKGKETLIELLNSAYKKGIGVERCYKKRTLAGETQEVESFDVYCPIAMANIWGMESILGDRCITIILEKSSNTKITKLIENFEHNIEFKTIRGGLNGLTGKLKEDIDFFGDLYEKWNSSVKGVLSDVSETTVLSDVKNLENCDTMTLSDAYDTILERIKSTNIDSRALELFFPLFIIADMVGEEVLEKLLNLAKEVVNEKKEIDSIENRDVQLYEFISQYNNSQYELSGFVSSTELVNQFREYFEINESWINPTWIGKALRRLKLIKETQRTGKNRKVKLNILKAKEKILMFKEPEVLKNG